MNTQFDNKIDSLICTKSEPLIDTTIDTNFDSNFKVIVFPNQDSFNDSKPKFSGTISVEEVIDINNIQKKEDSIMNENQVNEKFKYLETSLNEKINHQHEINQSNLALLNEKVDSKLELVNQNISNLNDNLESKLLSFETNIDSKLQLLNTTISSSFESQKLQNEIFINEKFSKQQSESKSFSWMVAGVAVAVATLLVTILIPIIQYFFPEL